MYDPYNQRLVAGTAGTLSWQQIDGTGEPADPGTVTVTVTRADGTVLASAQATDGSGTDPRTYALSVAQTATLDRLSVAWVVSGTTVATTEVDVVAAPWFGNAELRNVETGLNDAVRYDAAKVTTARLQVEAFIEGLTNRRFVPGYTLETLPGVSGPNLVVRHPDVRRVRSALLLDDPGAAATETLATGELTAIPASASGIVTRYANSWAARWVRIGYEHGMTVPPPDLKRAAMRLVRELLVNEVKGQIPDNATNFNSTEMGWSAVLVTPGVRGAHTRLPTVNKAIDDWTFEQIGMA
ncbi:MAG: hypothetical protein KA274_16930 [Ilumatobacteraceae bacterium]|nr:hypothetical protein [Ilumatobacteraceae bacterium]MBP6728121.1 hypothetical protein [Microthrixaceae bacterium]